ncbi:uncharacterized protein LOC130258490 [Oenanthe melanoleuca]|uniref:uncharacterized protein LOC130258490 n=1 Tax=Oenanthe melanoleuca TaxID=2939378 RepID=UPI0024C1021A|nr:uncharacterized protein LOC130258490 [Oenanthe melanoleuca]
MWEMLKEMLRGKQEMKGQAVQEEQFPRGSKGAVPESINGREVMPGTVTGDDSPRKNSPLAWLHRDLKPLEPPAGVSAGRISQSSGLDAAHKASPHFRVALKGNIRDTGDKNSMETSEVIQQMLKEMQQGGQGMKGEAVQKQEAFPIGSSGSVPVSAAGREAMPGTVTGDDARRKISPLPWLNKDLKPFDSSAGVSARNNFPARLLIATRKPSSHHRGSPRGKNKDVGEKESLESNDILEDTVKELQKGRGMKGEAVQKQEAFPIGSSGSVPVSAAGREAMPGTVTGDMAPGKVSTLPWLNKDLKPFDSSAGVSAGNTFPASLLIATRKPSSHHMGTQRGKNKDMAEKESLEAKDFLEQSMVKLQKGREMDMEVLWKAVFPHGSSRSLAAPASRGKAMPGTGTGTGTGDGIAGKVSPLAWWYEVLKPLEPPAGVPAGRISPTPVLDAAHKPSSHPRGPPTEKTKHTTDKKFLKPFEVMRQMLKGMLQERQEVDGEDVLKAAFPGGSSVSIAGKEPMPGTVTGDWDRDLDYLEALVEYGMKFLKDAEDEPIGEGDLGSQPTSREEPLGAGEGVSAGRISSPPGLNVAHKTSSDNNRKTQENGAKISVDSDEFLRQTQKKVQGGQVVKQKSVQKEAHPNGSSGSVPASPAGGTAMPGTGTGTGTGTGDAAGTSTCVTDSQEGNGKGFLQDKLTWLELISGLLVLEFFCIVACIAIWNCWKRKRHTSGQQMKDGGNTSHSQLEQLVQQ